MRFDNGLYLRVEGSGTGLSQFAELRYALFGTADGAPLTLPMADAARHIRGGFGYRLTTVVGVPLVPRKRAGSPQDAAALDAMKMKLGVKRGRLFLSAATHPDRLGPGAPVFHARAEFQVDAPHLGQSVDYSAAAQRIAASLDDMKDFLASAMERSRYSAL